MAIRIDGIVAVDQGLAGQQARRNAAQGSENCVVVQSDEEAAARTRSRSSPPAIRSTCSAIDTDGDKSPDSNIDVYSD
jgi:hypothetical protein